MTRGSFLVIAGIMALVGVLAAANDHKDAGVGLVIAAGALALLTVEPVRKVTWKTITTKPSKGMLIILAAIAVMVVSVVKWGPVTIAQHIGTGVENTAEWSSKFFGGFQDGK